MCFFSFLEKSSIQTPTNARTGENEVGFNSCIKKLLLSIPLRLKIHEVTVVPILAPMIMPTAWESFIIPEFTKPTTMTVVAEELWISAVTPAPSATALIGLLVMRSRIFSSLPPDTLDNPSPSRCIPYKNRASPPTIDNIPKKSIIASSYAINRFPRNYFIIQFSITPQEFIYFTYILHSENASW